MEETNKGVMMEETRRQKIWKWAKENADIVAVTGMTIGGFALAVWINNKNAQNIVNQRELLKDALSQGHPVVVSRKGKFLIIPKEG